MHEVGAVIHVTLELRNWNGYLVDFKFTQFNDQR